MYYFNIIDSVKLELHNFNSVFMLVIIYPKPMSWVNFLLGWGQVSLRDKEHKL